MLRSVIAPQGALALAVVARRPVAHAATRRVVLLRRQAVAGRIAATGRIAVTNARTYRIFVAGARAPGAEVRTCAVAVDRGAFDAGAVIVAITVGAMTIATLLIGRIGREVTGTAIGRALVDVIILLLRIGQPLIGRSAAAGVAARIKRCRDVALLARADISLSAWRA